MNLINYIGILCIYFTFFHFSHSIHKLLEISCKSTKDFTEKKVAIEFISKNTLKITIEIDLNTDFDDDSLLFTI